MTKIVIGVFDSLMKMKKVLNELVNNGFNHLGPIVSFGPLAKALTNPSIHASAGGIIGALTELGVKQGEAECCAKAVKHGNKLLAVHVDEGMLKQAVEIMRKNDAAV